MNFIQFWTRALIVLGILALLAGCKSTSGSRNIAPLSIGVLGVTYAPGIDAGRDVATVAREFRNIVQTEGKFQTLGAEELATALNAATPGSYENIIGYYGTNGWLRGDNMRALFAAKLPVKSVLLARLEMNDIRPGAPKRTEVLNSNGQVLSDRERVILSTIREMRLQASLLDLASGSVVWSKTYRATPSTESSYVRYSGTSFSSSLVASVANTMTNGLRAPDGPKPPSNTLTLQSLMREVVKNLPKQ